MEWPLAVSEKLLENDFVSVKLDDHGRFTSVFDKLDEREISSRPDSRAMYSAI